MSSANFFLAITLPAHVQEQLETRVAQFRGHLRALGVENAYSWETPADWHLTIWRESLEQCEMVIIDGNIYDINFKLIGY